MEYPKRVSNHISESESFRILSANVPKEWIIREIAERDYGVDLYLEIIGADGKVTGKLAALQVKSSEDVNFSDKGSYTFTGIKRATVNYWLGLPVPVFLIVVCIKTRGVYWASVENSNREGRFAGDSDTVSMIINKNSNLSKEGLLMFELTYLREKRWVDVENAIEKSLMSYNTLGPLILMCKRRQDKDICSTTIQYLLIQHYEYYSLLQRYLRHKKPKELPYWYERHLEYIEANKVPPTLTFSFGVIKEMIKDFVWEYRECIIAAYRLVTDIQKDYFSAKYPYLVVHLEARPHTFVMDDWAPRYFFDEYESETKHPEKLFFEDFTEFDKMLDKLSAT